MTLFVKGSYPSALFLSIVAMEELGKVAVAKVQAVFGVPGVGGPSGIGGGKSPLRSHRKKQVLAAMAGAVINERLDRIVGLDRVIKFIEKAESGELETLRQDCLYYDVRDGEQHLPYQAVKREEAELALTIAGELLAEVGSVSPEEWDRLLRKVAEFETSEATACSGLRTA